MICLAAEWEISCSAVFILPNSIDIRRKIVYDYVNTERGFDNGQAGRQQKAKAGRIA